MQANPRTIASPTASIPAAAPIAEPTETDAAFVGRLIAAQPAAWRQFWRRYRVGMQHQLRALAGPAYPALADELIAEIMIKLCDDGYRRLRMFDPTRGSLLTYLHTVVRNVYIDDSRRRRRGGRLLASAQEAVSAGDGAPAWHGTCQSIEASYRAMAARAELRRLTATLSAGEAALVEALVGADDDAAIAARTLGIDLPTLYSRKHKTVRKLRRVALCAAA